jgi:hypothetical protein
VLERWQISPIINIQSGTLFSFTSGSATINQLGDNTPMLVGTMPSSGTVTRVADGVVYFPNLKQTTDPQALRLTTAQALNTRSTLLAITDSSGNLLLVNPEPGVLGNLAPLYGRGPSQLRFDVNLVKRIRIGERKEFEFRADAIDILNTPQFGTPENDINSNGTFGRITTAGGNRIIVLGARINF